MHIRNIAIICCTLMWAGPAPVFSQVVYTVQTNNSDQQTYAAIWSDLHQADNLLSTMLISGYNDASYNQANQLIVMANSLVGKLSWLASQTELQKIKDYMVQDLLAKDQQLQLKRNGGKSVTNGSGVSPNSISSPGGSNPFVNGLSASLAKNQQTSDSLSLEVGKAQAEQSNAENNLKSASSGFFDDLINKEQPIGNGASGSGSADVNGMEMSLNAGISEQFDYLDDKDLANKLDLFVSPVGEISEGEIAESSNKIENYFESDTEAENQPDNVQEGANNGPDPLYSPLFQKGSDVLVDLTAPAEFQGQINRNLDYIENVSGQLVGDGLSRITNESTDDFDPSAIANGNVPLLLPGISNEEVQAYNKYSNYSLSDLYSKSTDWISNHQTALATAAIWIIAPEAGIAATVVFSGVNLLKSAINPLVSAPEQ